MTGILDVRGPNAAYGHATLLLFGALVKLTADYLLTSNLGDYVWRLFWVLATAFWTFRLLRQTNQLPEQDSSATLLARRASLTVMAMTFAGAAVSGR